ncbi:MAG: MBL fold metallo-hydrolase [Phycisphaerales bacterium]|nr:MAG: MBL fold metallo-hydrolase [Phycisphaerales bacterium]
MKRLLLALTVCVATCGSTTICCADDPARLSPHVSVSRRAVNGVFIEKDGRTLVVYGDPGGRLRNADMVLFTHSRRDVAWAGRELVENGTVSVVPEGEADSFSKVGDFWSSFGRKMFHDYAQQTTRVLTEPIRVGRKVKDGDVVLWRNVPIRVIETPGYTRGSASYFVSIDGIKYGFVGDIIYGNGQLLDLYSLQDAVPEAQIGGYHGYAGRLGELIRSLHKVIDQNPDILVPARGPVIRDPKPAIERLVGRLRAAYENYLSINAGHWYFKERYETLAARVLEQGRRVSWMPYARTIENAPPGWIIPINNSRLIISEDGAGFLIDCGSDAIIARVKLLRQKGRLSHLEGLFITHYHDDHTDRVNKLVAEFECPVYVTQIMEDVLRHPQAYRLPAMTSEAIPNLKVVADGHEMQWKEFKMTFYDFPGQTVYHDALFVEKEDGGKIFFVGDSFTPSGIDDYCLQNRNFLHRQMGYFYCLQLLQEMPPDYLLINQHVVEPFRLDENQIAHITAALAERKRILADLFPWDEPNYGIDEQWVRMYPYSQQAKPGRNAAMSVMILNHSDVSHEYTVVPIAPQGFKLEPEKATVSVAPREQKSVRFRVAVPNNVPENVYVLTLDIRFDKWDLRRWCEAIIDIRR